MVRIIKPIYGLMKSACIDLDLFKHRFDGAGLANIAKKLTYKSDSLGFAVTSAAPLPILASSRTRINDESIF